MSGDLEGRICKARERLGVGPRASSDTVRRAFRLRSLETHPDRGGARADFEELRAAYELIRDVETDTDEDWLLDDATDTREHRVIYDSEPKARRRSFQQLFVEALHRND